MTYYRHQFSYIKNDKHIYVLREKLGCGDILYMAEKEEMQLIEYEMERVINKQLYEENHITYDVYKKVADMIIKDIEIQIKKTQNQY